MNIQSHQTVSLLLVEDDDIDAMGVDIALESLHLTNPLHRARDGMEALEMLRSAAIKPPYLILLDLNMPRMSGIELLKELRNDPELTDSIVFVLTNSNDNKDITAAYKAHVAGYVIKSKLNSGFNELANLLDTYCRLIEMPLSRASTFTNPYKARL